MLQLHIGRHRRWLTDAPTVSIGLIASILIFVVVGSIVDARIVFTSQSPTYPESSQATPYIGFHMTPADPLLLQYSEIVRFQPADGGAVQVYEVFGPIPYVEYDVTLKGYTPRFIRQEQSTTFSQDTLGLETDQALPGTVTDLPIPTRSFSSMSVHAAAAAATDTSSPTRDVTVRQKQIKTFVNKRMQSHVRRLLSPKDIEFDAAPDSALAICINSINRNSGSNDYEAAIVACVGAQERTATDTASKLSSQSKQIQQMKNFALRMSQSFNTLNGTFASMYDAMLAQMALDNNQTASIDRLRESLAQTMQEEATAKAALAASQAAFDLQVAYDTNMTLLAVHEASELARLTNVAEIGNQLDQNIIRQTFNVLLKMTTTSSAQLSFESQQLAFSSSVIRGLATILTAMMRNDQTRGIEISQQNAIFDEAHLNGWRPWVFNYGQAPIDFLPTAWQAETLGYSDYFWVDPVTTRVVRDHHTLMCDVQRLVQNAQLAQVTTFIDLFSVFSTQQCFGAYCNCRVHRARHEYTGPDAAAVTSIGAFVGASAPTDSYAIALRNWVWNANWTQALAEPVPVAANTACSSSVFSPLVDPYLCAEARSVDHVSTVSTSSYNPFDATATRSALSTERWSYVSDTWFSTATEVTTLLQDQCRTTLHARFPYQQTIGMNAFAWQMDMPEQPTARTYCNPAFDTILTSLSIGRPFMYIAMQNMVKYFGAWRSVRATALQQLLDGYAASPQIVDAKPFHYELVSNGTVPALLRARTMYSASVSLDAEPVYQLGRRRTNLHLTLRRLRVDPASYVSPRTHATYEADDSFVPVRLGTTMLHDVPSVSQFDALPSQLKWVGYPRCMYETCPFKVLGMSRDPLNPINPVGNLTSVATFRDAAGQTHAGYAYVLDTSDDRTVTNTNEGSLRQSDTYGYMPLGAGAAAAVRSANTSSLGAADGVSARFFSPTLYEWSQVHQGGMDPRHVGTGVGTYAVKTFMAGGNDFNVQCDSTRAAVSDKCTWLDKFYVDFDVTSRGTARMYARNWNMEGLLPMPDQGNILLSIVTACPEDVQVHAQIMQQTSIEMTNTVFKADQFVYVVSSRCDSIAGGGDNADVVSTFSAATRDLVSSAPSMIDAIIGAAWQAATKSVLPVSVQERDMTTWIPYQTHTATVSGCNGQSVEIYATTRAIMLDVQLRTYMSAINPELYALLAATSESAYAAAFAAGSNNTALFAAIQTQANSLVSEYVAQSVAPSTLLSNIGASTQVMGAATLGPITCTRCLSWLAGNTVVLATDVQSSVVTQVQYTSDAISNAFRSVQQELSFAMQQSFTETENIINNVFAARSTYDLNQLLIGVENSNAENAAAQAALRQVVLNANNNFYANGLVNAATQRKLDELLATPDEIAGLLADLAETAQLRKNLLAQEALLLQQFRGLLDEFNAIRANITNTNYAYAPPLDMLPEDIANTLSLMSLSPCLIDSLDVFDDNNYVFNSDDSWLGGSMMPLRYWIIATIVQFIAWMYVQCVPCRANGAYRRNKPPSKNKKWMRKRTCCCFNCGEWWYPAREIDM